MAEEAKQEDLSPEEKLLRVIQDDSAPSAKGQEPGAGDARPSREATKGSAESTEESAEPAEVVEPVVVKPKLKVRGAKRKEQSGKSEAPSAKGQEPSAGDARPSREATKGTAESTEKKAPNAKLAPPTAGRKTPGAKAGAPGMIGSANVVAFPQKKGGGGKFGVRAVGRLLIVLIVILVGLTGWEMYGAVVGEKRQGPSAKGQAPSAESTHPSHEATEGTAESGTESGLPRQGLGGQKADYPRSLAEIEAEFGKQVVLRSMVPQAVVQVSNVVMRTSAGDWRAVAKESFSMVALAGTKEGPQVVIVDKASGDVLFKSKGDTVELRVPAAQSPTRKEMIVELTVDAIEAERFWLSKDGKRLEIR